MTRQAGTLANRRGRPPKGVAWSKERALQDSTQPDRLAAIRQAALDSAAAPDRPNLKKGNHTHRAHMATCVSCGCTDAQACPNGCSWITVDRTLGMGVCSSCVRR